MDNLKTLKFATILIEIMSIFSGSDGSVPKTAQTIESINKDLLLSPSDRQEESSNHNNESTHSIEKIDTLTIPSLNMKHVQSMQ